MIGRMLKSAGTYCIAGVGVDKKLPYSTQKIIHHPAALNYMRLRIPQSPVQIHFMPALACNQHCTFCAYGHRTKDDGEEQMGWKNMEMMSDAFLPRTKMMECVKDWKAMGVKAIEVTGGGEPLIWPHIDEFFQLVAEWGVDIALVTNGTALTEKRADMFDLTNWRWARVSIDAGSLGEYCATRRVNWRQWNLALQAIRRLADRKSDSEQRVGVGYVVDHSNWSSVYEGIRIAKAYGADNVRISAAFTPQNVLRFPPEAVKEATAQGAKAKEDFEDSSFQVNDLFAERVGNLLLGAQDYEYCAAKEVICIVGGDQNVYTCCTLAFNAKGLVGSIADQSFRELWEGEHRYRYYAHHDARIVCDVECLYEKRNKQTLRLLEASEAELEALREQDTSIHRNFI
jgi:wyosine [tRNA(Phe)-imidazoG37] synthetase (radical SAM superfamily)